MTRTRSRLLLAACIVAAATMTGRDDISAQTRGGTIKGHVKLTGKLPGNSIIRMGMDPKCAQANAGRRVIQETVAATIDGSLANVFVTLQGNFPKTAVPAQPVVIDQRGCLYAPRVVGARVGQTLQVKNSDDLLHNVHGMSAKTNSFNISEPKAGMVQQFTLKDEEIMLKVKCDVHSWMTSYVGVVNHPYFAVTNQMGTFEIDNVPPGTYTIQAWQEKYGPVTQKVTVKAGAAATADFMYDSGEKK